LCNKNKTNTKCLYIAALSVNLHIGMSLDGAVAMDAKRGSIFYFWYETSTVCSVAASASR